MSSTVTFHVPEKGWSVLFRVQGIRSCFRTTLVLLWNFSLKWNWFSVYPCLHVYVPFHSLVCFTRVISLADVKGEATFQDLGVQGSCVNLPWCGSAGCPWPFIPVLPYLLGFPVCSFNLVKTCLFKSCLKKWWQII